MNKPARFTIAPTFRERMQAEMKLSPERQAKLDEAMAQINAAFPKPIGPAEIFAKLIAAGQPVLIVGNGRAVSFNEEGA